jgi:hypothetical protein
MLDLLPVKSRQIYEKEYSFIRWKEINNVVIIDEYANYLHENVSFTILYITITLPLCFIYQNNPEKLLWQFFRTESGKDSF